MGIWQQSPSHPHVSTDPNDVDLMNGRKITLDKADHSSYVQDKDMVKAGTTTHTEIPLQHMNGHLGTSSLATSDGGYEQFLKSVLPDDGQTSSWTSGRSSRDCQEPIAIVGMGCLLPGGISNPSELWDFLVQSRSAHSKVPSSRYNSEAFYHENLERPGAMDMDSGYYIAEDVAAFENAFFNINNLEAQYMDPQQRKLLEVVYESFESAGVTLKDVSGANVGCFVGNFVTDYQHFQRLEPESLHRYTATGTGATILANRISHVFNLKGPSFVIDTACSSSLYCLHAACTALESEECDAAVVAASNLLLSPITQMATAKAGVLSADGKCKTFDSSADGYGRADATGALYLKRLTDAIRDGDPIRSVIRGTAVNSNGRTNGITLPSMEGQEEVIKKAYMRANLPTDATEYVECHGTGTAVGDPIEVEALVRAFGVRRGTPLLIGSVKTNLGHSEAASGITSIIKATLSLERAAIPPSIGIKEVNSKLKLDDWNMSIVTKMQSWPLSPDSGQIRRASVNSFGYGGANAHAILESFPGHNTSSTNSAEHFSNLKNQKMFVLPFSATQPASLEARVTDLAASIDTILPKATMADIAHTLAHHRSKLPLQGFVLVRQPSIRDDLIIEKLRTLPSGTEQLNLPVAFVFTGQGAQWPQMGRELIEKFPVFRRSIQDLDYSLSQIPKGPAWTLFQTILEDPKSSQISSVSRSQPVCSAIQIALVDLLASWGVHPKTVAGHSSGEIAAAYAAGHITAREAIETAYYRGHVVSNLASRGAMVAVGADETSISQTIKALNLSAKIKVACVNSPESVTVSGEEPALDELVAHLQPTNTFTRKLRTDGRAYHSHQMALAGPDYEDLLRLVFHTRPSQAMHRAQMYSSLTGKAVSANQTRNPYYWRANLESPVLFKQAIEAQYAEEGQCQFVELGPHSALEQPLKQIMTHLTAQEVQTSYSSALIRGKSSEETILNLLGMLYLRGYTEALHQYNSEISEFSLAQRSVGPRVLSNLPKYKWCYDEEVLWHEPTCSSDLRKRKVPRHDLLGAEVNGTSATSHTWRNILRTMDVPWLEGHKLGETVIFPGACFVMMAVEALHRVFKATSFQAVSMRDVHILKALPFPTPETKAEIYTEIWPKALSKTTASEYWWEFKITTLDEAKISTEHAVGSISLKSETYHDDIVLDETRLMPQAARTWYRKFQSTGLNFQHEFQSITDVSVDRRGELMIARANTKLVAAIESHQESQSKYMLHPIALDAGLQAGVIATTAGVVAKLKPLVPTTVGSIVIYPPHESSYEQPVTINARSKRTGVASVNIEGDLRDWQGRLLIQIGDVRAVEYQGFLDRASEHRYPMLRIGWRPDINSMIEDQDSFTLKRYLDSLGDVDDSDRKLVHMLDLIVHRDPGLRILHLGVLNQGHENNLMVEIGKCLNLEDAFPRCRSLVRGSILQSGILGGVDIFPTPIAVAGPKPVVSDTPKFDVALLILPDQPERVVPLVLEALTSKAYLLTFADSTTILQLEERGITFNTKMQLPDGNYMAFGRKSTPEAASSAQAKETTKVEREADPWTNRQVKLLTDDPSGKLECMLLAKLNERFGDRVDVVPSESISPTTIPSQSIVVSLLELHQSLLTTVSNTAMGSLKTLVENASVLLWITSGDLMSGSKPDMALWQGASRTIMVENPTLRSITFDVDSQAEELELTTSNIMNVLNSENKGFNKDLEYAQKDGILHISRFLPEKYLNDTFTRKKTSGVMEEKLGNAGLVELRIKEPGQIDSLYFQQRKDYDETMPPSHLEIEVKAIGLNAKDFYTFAAKVDTANASTSLECTGLVTKVGANVSGYAVGDRVLSMAPVKFQTIQRVPEWSCCKLLDRESFEEFSTVSLVYASAIFALEHRAGLREGESILIHSGAGGLGIAAIQLSQMLGAEIYVTVSSEAKRKYLSQTFNIPIDHIFSSRNASFLPDVLRATKGRGVDVVLNSLTGDLLHESVRACAEFGRFIEVGKSELVGRGRLDMATFLKGVTFSAFDLADLYHSENPKHQRTWQGLLMRAIELVRQTKVKPVQPLKVFDVSQVADAFRHFSSRNRLGKIAISLEQPESVIKLLPVKYDAKIDPEKSYLLVGCLGGLGRSLARYLFEQGARRFVFLGLTGTEKEPARRLVDDLEAAGAHIKVIKGSASEATDVERFVAAAESPIGGVIHAAMGLHESLFTDMSAYAWHKSIGPKQIGAWNLHRSLQNVDAESTLDFFIMTSSINGSIGTATEANYCAANYFLDIFSRHRRNQNLAATAVGFGLISGIGYLHENPEIEAMLMGKGVRPLEEEDVLHIFDSAVTESIMNEEHIRKHGNPLPSQYEHAPEVTDPLCKAHILTGLESSGLQGQRNQGFDGYHNILGEPRAALLVEKFNNAEGSSDSANASGIPPQISAALSSNDNDKVVDACYEVIGKKFAQIMLTSMEKLNPKAPLSDFGMDSMLAAEFRKFIFQTCGVDVPFLTILDAGTSILTLAQIVATDLQGASN